MEMGRNFDGFKESENQAIDELQTTICSSLPLGGEVEEAVKRGIQTFTPSLVEDSVKNIMQTIMPPLVEEAVLKGIRASIPGLVEEVLHKKLEALMPVMVEEIRKMISASLPLLQPFNRPSSSRQLPHVEVARASRTLHLHFERLSQPFKRIFTWKSLCEQGTLLQVVLKDDSGNIVEAGADSSMKIKIVVLDGDFSVENGKTFHENVCPQRDNKPPLLAGKCDKQALNKGVADVSDIMFTDNSSWMRSKKFRLGAEVVKSVSDGVVVREAVSEAFEVKERRGECYQKKETPALTDEVWRLRNIAKDGKIHKKLVEEKIESVNDLLKMHQVNPERLKNIIHLSDKKFKDIIEHAESALFAHSNSILPEYDIDVNGGIDTIPQAYEIPNELSRICGRNCNSLFPADNILQATGSSASILLDVAAANPGDSELQLMLSDSPAEHLPLPAEQRDRVLQIENELWNCVGNNQPKTRHGLNKPRWRSVGVALRFSLFRIVIKRQACRARKKQRYY